MTYIKYFIYTPFIKKTLSVKNAQKNVLLNILKKNADTTFGKEHYFKEVKDYHTFKSQVPMQDYESLRPYIEEHEKNKTFTLFNEHVLMYAHTSGTTGKPKYIPILESTVKNYQKSQSICSYAQYKGIPGLYQGKILAISSPECEGKNEYGTLVGSMSGILYKKMPSFVRKKYVIPNEVLAIPDYDVKYFMIAAFSLAEKNITTMSTANPSTFLKLMQVMNFHRDQLIEFIANADINLLNINDPDIRNNCCNIIRQYFKPNLNRALELKQIFNQPCSTYNDFWPNLKAVITWTGGNCAVLIPKLQSLLSPTTLIAEIGYLSTEFRGSIVIDTKNNQAVPALHEVFYEFVEKSDWENDYSNFCTVDEIQPGKYYYIFVTTANGLYRYFINDIIKVTGKLNDSPTIVFAQKGKGTTNLTGEKLYEEHLLQALKNVSEEIQIEPHFFIMIGDPDNLQYTLYIEHKSLEVELGDLVDKWLCDYNVEFKAKKLSGRLKPTKVKYLRTGTDDMYKRHCINNGQKEGQYKIIKLQLTQDCTFDFERFLHE